MTPKIKYRVGIIGCGKMGKDLLDFFRNFDFHLTLVCSTEASMNDIQSAFSKNQERALKYKLIDQEPYEFRLKNTMITTELNQLSNCDLIIEAVTEDVNLKKNLFRQLETIIPEDCIIASNTSSISPDRLFKKMLFHGRYIGLHFFYPVKMKHFVEINLAKNTSIYTLERVKDFLSHIGKYSLILRDSDHFLINRIFLKMQAGCCQLLNENKFHVSEIDDQVKRGLFPIGVFEFFDHVGIDVMLQSVKNYISYESDPLFYQTLIDTLEVKAVNGEIGKKTGSGFYNYTGKEKEPGSKTVEKNDALLKQIAHWYLDGVYEASTNSACTKDEITQVVKEYMMVEKNPFVLAKEIGYTPK
jgi:3-hydroxybutyryl-CoA dehydrogenase